MGKYSKVEEKLIGETQNYPVLWNTKDKNYKNKNAKEIVWQLVAQNVNTACQSTYTGNTEMHAVLCFLNFFYKYHAYVKSI